MDEEVEVALNTDDREEWEALREIAESEEGIELVESRNLDPFTAIILVGGIFAVAGVVLKWIKRLHDRDSGKSYGQVIDLRPSAKDPVYRDKDLDYGQIVIITPTSDGKDIKVTVETYDPDNDFTKIGKDIFDKLATSVGKSVESIKEIIEKATGSKGAVTVEDAPALT